ncbi:nickel-responsive transcriptional regulator NikR [Thermodesulfobacteriota bacterium]
MKRSQVVRFGVSIQKKLLDEFDQWLEEHRYANRSEAIRDLIRDQLVETEWEEGEREVVGTVTLVYSHEIRELTEKLTAIQHDSHGTIVSTLHVHLDHHNCLEVLILRGRAEHVRDIADQLIGCRGVKHGKFTMTTTGKDLV